MILHNAVAQTQPKVNREESVSSLNGADLLEMVKLTPQDLAEIRFLRRQY